MTFVTAFWCTSNTTIYPTDLYGDVLKLEFEFAPYFIETANNLPYDMHTARAWLTNVHFFLGSFTFKAIYGRHLDALGLISRESVKLLKIWIMRKSHLDEKTEKHLMKLMS